jgi:hypothetical protein
MYFIWNLLYEMTLESLAIWTTAPRKMSLACPIDDLSRTQRVLHGI